MDFFADRCKSVPAYGFVCSLLRLCGPLLLVDAADDDDDDDDADVEADDDILQTIDIGSLLRPN